jgi:hypothetical protein
MYGLKAVPFREASFSAACEAVRFVQRLLSRLFSPVEKKTAGDFASRSFGPV